MASKRKCVRKAVIEISDSGDSDDESIEIVETEKPAVKSEDFATNRRETGARGAAVANSGSKRGKADDNKRLASPKKQKEQGIPGISNKGNNQTGRQRSTFPRPKQNIKQETAESRNRKRKRSKSPESNMGSSSSKADESVRKKKLEKKCEEQIRRATAKLSVLKSQNGSSTLTNCKINLQTGGQRDLDPQPSAATSDISASSKSADWTEVDYVRTKHELSQRIAENIVSLFEDENTIPFVARYRKDKTDGMDAEELRRVKTSWETAKAIKAKALALSKEIDKQGKWTPDLHVYIHNLQSLSDLNEIQNLYKVTKETLAEKSRKLGLGETADSIYKGESVNALRNLIQPQKAGLNTEEEVKTGIVFILADSIIKDKETFETTKRLREEYNSQITLQTSLLKSQEKAPKKFSKKEDDATKYELYHNFTCSEINVKPYQILAINRAEAKKIISSKIVIPTACGVAFKKSCSQRYWKVKRASNLHSELFDAAIERAWNSSIKQSLERRIKKEMKRRAEIASMDVFAGNIKQLLLSPPLRGKIVLGIDPGFSHGCKLAVVSEHGDLVTTDTIYPHVKDGGENARAASAQTLVRIVKKYECTFFALGNGTACRETEVFIDGLIRERAFGKHLDIRYAIVDETGASIYSCSAQAAAEFPNLPDIARSAISIARRLQDPMAELVKIEPQHLGVGMYQHDLPEKQLADKLNEVIMEAVSFVGVDVNTASVSLLKRIAGLGEATAKNIVEWRKASGPFKSREDLRKVSRIGPKTFLQCAGFLRILPETAVSSREGYPTTPTFFDYLDQTWIHPESYAVARKFLELGRLRPDQLGTKDFVTSVSMLGKMGAPFLANRLETTVQCVDVIVQGLSMLKGEDIRPKQDMSVFRSGLTSFDDLEIGTKLTGVVRNITHFGAFVDVGVERSGLIHTSKMDGYVLCVGQTVSVSVNNIEKARGRLGLTLVSVS